MDSGRTDQWRWVYFTVRIDRAYLYMQLQYEKWDEPVNGEFFCPICNERLIDDAGLYIEVKPCRHLDFFFVADSNEFEFIKPEISDLVSGIYNLINLIPELGGELVRYKNLSPIETYLLAILMVGGQRVFYRTDDGANTIMMGFNKQE